MSCNNFEFAWIYKLTVRHQNGNLSKLEAALDLINSFKSMDEINNLKDFKDALDLIYFFIKNELFNLKIHEIKRIIRYVRKLWFLNQSQANEQLDGVYSKFLNDLIRNTLEEIYEEEKDLELSEEQMKRCILLISLFSYYYDDIDILGISKFDYLFVIVLIQFLNRLIDKLINENKIRTENLYRVIYMMDKMISNWLDIFKYVDKKQYRKSFLANLTNQLVLLINSCKEKYKLASLAIATIVGNLKKLENLL